MRWNMSPSSRRLENRRGRSGIAARGGGRGIEAPLVLGLLGWALGVAPRMLVVAALLGSTEEVFGALLPQEPGSAYVPPRLVVVWQTTRSGCGLAAAGAIGDGRLQDGSGASVLPDSFTHGSSAQRREWLLRGLGRGEIAACDTFG